MNFRCKTIVSALGLLMASGASLGAQDFEQTVKAGLINPQGDMRVLTQSPLGFGLEYNLDLKPTAEAGIGIGMVAGWFNAPGKKVHGAFLQPNGAPTDSNGNVDPMYVDGTCNIKAAYVGADILYAVTGTPVTIRTGPTLVTWDITQRYPAGTINGIVYGGAMGETTWKLGWRLGADYRISKEWCASIMYSQAHWLNTTSSVNSANVFQSNPSWVTLMAGYKF